MGENKNKILRRKRIRKRRNFLRAMSVTLMSIFMMIGALNKSYAIEVSKDKISLLNAGDSSTESADSSDTSSDTQNDDNSSEQLEGDNEENADKENESKYKNTSAKGQKYVSDVREVTKKLKKYDYSNSGKKTVYLTFDDGPSNTVTPKILSTLKEYDVKATFFIMGKELNDGGQEASKLLKEEYDEGHAIGNHSYSHEYDILYPGRSLNLESFKKDYDKNSKLLKGILGEDFSTRALRCPGGYMSWKNMDKLDKYLEENNMGEIDWSALSKDAEGKKKNADELYNCAVETSKNQEMVVLLMHDTYGKEETAKSLPKIIEYFKNNGYEFRTLG